MEKFLKILKKVPLFYGIQEQEIFDMLSCLGAQIKTYNKGETIFRAGENVSTVGIVLSGSVQIILEDVLGNRNIISAAYPGELFVEAFSCSETDKLPASVIVPETSEIMFINYKRIIQTCSSACRFHAKMIANMLKDIAEKNVMLNQKIECMSKRTTRDKLLAYLSAQAQKAGSVRFTIPFNRQELADYLCVDRSAMSNELSKLKEEGIVDFERSHFKISSLKN